jgi:hypothetical protein
MLNAPLAQHLLGHFRVSRRFTLATQPIDFKCANFGAVYSPSHFVSWLCRRFVISRSAVRVRVGAPFQILEVIFPSISGIFRSARVAAIWRGRSSPCKLVAMGQWVRALLGGARLMSALLQSFALITSRSRASLVDRPNETRLKVMASSK